MIFLMDSPKVILKTLKSAKNIIIPLHLRPDGDMVGSALAFYHFLKDLGKKVTVVSADPITPELLFLTAAKRIKIQDPAKLDLAKFETMLLCDNGDERRYSKQGKVSLPPKMVVINIDHHDSNVNFGDLNYVDKKAVSATQVIYEIFRLSKTPISPTVAQCLLTGLYTDSNSFTSSKTSDSSLTAGAELVKRGAQPQKVIENAFWSWSTQAPLLWQIILDNFKTRKGVAYSFISEEERKKVKATLAEVSAAKAFAAQNLMMAVHKIRASIVFVEENPQLIRVSLRSKGRFDVGKIAHELGGGGHTNSAAFDYHGTLRTALRNVVRFVTEA